MEYLTGEKFIFPIWMAHYSIRAHLMENQYSPGWHWLTIHDWKASKDQAIQVVLEAWDLDKAELVVFGDNDNDVTMFQAANRAIAVANATESLKGYASQIIGSNSEDSVARFIRDDWSKSMKIMSYKQTN